jgi:hypothetical protein
MKGHGFSRAINAVKSARALAPEEKYDQKYAFPSRLKPEFCGNFHGTAEGVPFQNMDICETPWIGLPSVGMYLQSERNKPYTNQGIR